MFSLPQPLKAVQVLFLTNGVSLVGRLFSQLGGWAVEILLARVYIINHKV